MSDESRWDSHPAGCKCPPCYYSDDEPFMGALAKTMPRPSVQLGDGDVGSSGGREGSE